jgi:hypothetical protein
MNSTHVSKFPDLLKFETPLAFADGTSIFNELSKKYIRHKTGFFILAPSGTGKTHFITNQKEPNWIDGDDIWQSTNAHPKGAWWLEPIPVIDEIDQRSDVITQEAKRLGFWIMGASNNWLKPDAVVIPDLDTHLMFIKKRETTNYDGGLKSEQIDRIKSSRIWMGRWEKEGVTIYKSVEDAVDSLVNKL